MWPENIFKKSKKYPKTLKEMFDAGMFSREEFLRFTITQQQVALDKTKKKLLDFLKKKKK